MVKFIPTGGVNVDTLAEYADKNFIHAIGGGWLCSSKDIANKDYESIKKTVQKSIDILLGFELGKADGISETKANNIERAAFYLESKGYSSLEKSTKEAFMKNEASGAQIRLTLK
jgi:hypothetical protein